MKKLGLLLISTILLSACSPKNGVMSKRDVENVNQEEIKSIFEEQRNVSYIPDDVKEFVIKTKDARDEIGEFYTGYLDINLNDSYGGHIQDSEFLYDIYYSNSEGDTQTKKEFDKLVDTLDETISKGIKLYLEKNLNEDIKGEGLTNQIGKVLIIITPIEYMDDIPRESQGKNELRLIMQARDIKDKEYKELVDNIKGENLILESINIGKEQNLIRLTNIENKRYDGYKLKNDAIHYQLFMKDKKIDKIRMTIITPSKEKIRDDLSSLERVTNTLEFDNDDIKKLEEIKSLVKENKTGKKTLSSKNYNFIYKNLSDKDYNYENTYLTDVVIEKKK